MRKAALDYWPTFTVNFEGRVPYFYTDKLGLVTAGIGNELDDSPINGPPNFTPPTRAFGLDWRLPDGTKATPSQISAEWIQTKKNHPTYQSVNSKNGPGLLGLRLSNDEIDRYFNSVSQADENSYRGLFNNYDALPADAQLALASMDYAEGTGELAKYVKLRAAINKDTPDFNEAANQSFMNGVGIEKRNAANKMLFQNAAKVLSLGLDPSKLYYPLDAASASGSPGSGPGGIPGWVIPAGIAVIVIGGGLLYLTRSKA